MVLRDREDDIMPNIFDGLNLMEDNSIRENIAMLEAVTMGNVMKGYGTTIANKGAKFINGVGGVFGKNPDITVKKEKRLADYIEEKNYELSYLNRAKLNLRLQSILREKTGCESSTEDYISACVINSVAKHMKLEENMTVSQKADGIHRRYLEKILNSMQESLKKQDSVEANKTVNEIEQSISKLSDKDKEELKRVLNIEELTGKEIRNVFMKAGTPTLIIGALSASGFGAFIALTTVMHAVFTTILGITLPFAVYTGATSTLGFLLGPAGIALVAGTAIWQVSKGNKNLKNEIMGQIVFASVSAMGGSFVAQNKDLPSYESDKERLEKIKEMDKEYIKLVEINQMLQNKVDILESRHEEYQKNINDYKIQIEDETARSKYSENQIIKLNSEKDVVSNNLKESIDEVEKLEKEIKKRHDEKLKLEIDDLYTLIDSYKEKFKTLNENITYQEHIIEYASAEINDKTKAIQEIEDKNRKLEKENEAYKKENEKIKDRRERTEKNTKKEIEEKWNRDYNKFEIKKCVIRDIVKERFIKQEIWEIERVLNELHSLNDYKSVSRGKITEKGIEYEHMGFNIHDIPVRILYRVTNNSDKKVIIERIYKHNKKLYQ